MAEIISERSYSESINHYTTAPGPASCSCVHCGKRFTGNSATQKLRRHLATCEKRILLRHLKFQDFIFILTLNPRAKLSAALTVFTKDKDAMETPAMVVGVIKFLKTTKQIKNFEAIEIKNSPAFLELQNGMTGYKRIFSSLSDEDKQRFGAFVEKTFQNRFKET